MSPALMEGDVVAWTPVNIEDVNKGDVIVFKSYVNWPDEKILVHRVSNITTNNKGNILLETKGDANKYTDQAGPHIPEPYVRESNLMGRVLSIGQQPLKIPFIGYLGIWINQGLDLISQPASAKGSLSYVGIFAPLTISAVILVILVFVLPEKARTIKEKIHLNIFGRKPLNMRRTLVSFLIAYIVFLMVIHAFAHDSLSTSMGINSGSEDSAMNFGRLKTGSDSFPKDLPIINPSTMPVKGVVFARGKIGDYVTRHTFELEKGQTNSISIKAISPVGAQNGTYTGEIMVYSSPFWLMFPDDFLQNLLNWNSEATPYILDLLSAVVLTTITMLILLSITFIGEVLTTWTINRSWRHPSRIFIKRKIIKKVSEGKERITRAIGKGIWWVTKLEIIHEEEKPIPLILKPLLASLVLIPILYFLNDQILAMFIAVIIAGVLAYYSSCKIRRKIIITAIITIALATTYMMIQSNLIILAKEQTLLELITLALGTMGIYLLLLALLLIPFSLASWAVTRLIRNLKERKDPLLSLEGSCDL
jgi:signal peptidase